MKAVRAAALHPHSTLIFVLIVGSARKYHAYLDVGTVDANSLVLLDHSENTTVRVISFW